MPETKPHYLGIDGGGSRTRAWLVDGDGRLIEAAESGPTNRHLVGIEGVALNLRDLFVDLWSRHDNRDLAAVVGGLAGAAGAQRELTEAIRLFLPPNLSFRLTTDAEIALSAAHAGAPGIVLIAGTGSICLARDAQDRLLRVGGRGPVLDDGGSGRWIGRRALETAARQDDGRLPGKSVLRAVLDHFEVDTMESLVPAVQAAPDQIPSLAPVIAALAEHGEADAAAIVEAALAELCALVEAIRRTPEACSLPLALAGGLLEAHRYLGRRLAAELDQRMPDLELRAARMPPVAGAVIEAYNLSGGRDRHTFASNLAAAL